VISIRSLSKRLGNRPTLDGVSAHIRDGETVAIVGPSGGGKTTLLRCLNALEVFDAGAISIAGFDIQPRGEGMRGLDLVRLRTAVGMVFQDLHLFPHLTVEENVLLAPRVVGGRSHADARRRAQGLLERIGLSDRRSAYPEDLSGGQKQRVAIARALAQEPRVLLLDEPTSALDPVTAEGVAKMITDMTRNSVTVVLVTHQLALAETMADRALCLDDGKLTEKS
jgi:ABC-type polar amino acid transport system ATPase subunit